MVVLAVCNNDMNKLFIGPWIGEFGVELLRWQSIARTVAQSRVWSEVIVATHPDRFFLYEDFADKFVAYKPKTIHTVGFGCIGHRDKNIHEDFINTECGDVWLNPQVEAETEKLYYPISACSPTYRNFSENVECNTKYYDLLIHARATNKSGHSFKNWSIANYNALIEALPPIWKIASIGAVDGAHKIKGTDDLRGVSLRNLASCFKGSGMVVGTSSGTIHYATHCGLPVVTWIGRDDRYNYYPVWNPFSAPICCLADWQPRPEVVAHKVLEMRKLIESQQQPVSMVVAGTICGGYREFVAEMADLNPQTHVTVWNACESQEVRGHPHILDFLPSINCFPKAFHRQDTQKTITDYNADSSCPVRVLTFQNIRLIDLSRSEEVQSARLIVIVIRDLANNIASLKSDELSLGRHSFLSQDFFEVIRTGEEYLREACGVTNVLGELKYKTVFISYNRWSNDLKYRKDIINVIKSYSDLDFSVLNTTLKATRNNEVWQKFSSDRSFWNAFGRRSTFELEKKLHLDCMPTYGDPPTIS